LYGKAEQYKDTTYIQEGNAIMKRHRISRRMLLGGSIGIAGLASNLLALSTDQGKSNTAYASPHIADHNNASMSDMAGMSDMSVSAVPSLPYLLRNVSPALNGGYNPSNFANVAQSADHGTIQTVNGQRSRVFNLVSVNKTITVALDNATGKSYQFAAWAFGTTTATAQVPGPTLRCTQGENIVINYTNLTDITHSIHIHGIHNTGNDGAISAVAPGKSAQYIFPAEPVGVMAYHCHVASLVVSQHIAQGLYGVIIIDPPGGPKPMAEKLLVMNAFAIPPLPQNGPYTNTVYAFNTVANHYARIPNQIALPLDTPIRLYLVNFVCGDAPMTFHLHANFFNVFPAGTQPNTPTQFNDMVTLSLLERYVLEFTYDSKHFTPGTYMFHSHDLPGERGMFGEFLLTNGAT
jgi:manganese oxidase